mmetsp:Transcript_41378/g.89692  ORF Transcript_41378/g.89692 Transcript_41378/m.89692 type:complete len:227 (+) Transcript_41378:1013-1693(+)
MAAFWGDRLLRFCSFGHLPGNALHFHRHFVNLQSQMPKTVSTHVIEILLQLHGLQHVVLDETGRCLGVMSPSTQRSNEFSRFYSTGLVSVNHFEEHLQIAFVDVHHSQTTLKIRVSLRTFNQLLKGELAATVQIYPLKQLRQGLPILLDFVFHLFSQVLHVVEPGISKSIYHDCNDEIQDTKHEGQQRTHEYHCSRWILLDHRHSNFTPTVPRNHSLEKQQVCLHY